MTVMIMIFKIINNFIMIRSVYLLDDHWNIWSRWVLILIDMILIWPLPMTVIMTVIMTVNIQKFKNSKILNNYILINGIYLLDYH